MVDKPLSGRNILVVEDEAMIQMFIEDILTGLGASVAAASSVDRALALIDAQVFDAALLDVSLSGRKSYPVAEELKARGIPFIFSTGDIASPDGYEERPLLKKPFRPRMLADVFMSILAGKSC